MGVKLIVEVLDRYDGPHKLWLVGFAEQANDQTRVGWPRRDLLARRARVSVSRSSHIAAELIAAKVIRRPDWEPDEGRDKRRAAYVLLPLAGADSAGKGTRKRAADSTEIGAGDSTDIGAGDSTDPGEIGAIRDTQIGAADSTIPGEIGAVSKGIGAVPNGIGAIGPPVSAAQTANPASPQSPQSPHNAPRPSGERGAEPPRRTTRTGSSGEPAATDDDDDQSGTPGSHAEDPWSGQPDDDDPGYETRPRRSPGLGQCPVCGGWFLAATGGRINRHSSQTPGREYGRCPGSGQPPVRPVRCTGCGRTGLALASLTGLCSACTRERKEAEAEPDHEEPW